MSNIFLSDMYTKYGNTIEGFISALREMEKTLSFFKTKSADITILSYIGNEGNKYNFYGFNPSKKIISEFPQLPLEAFEYELIFDDIKEQEVLLNELKYNKLCFYDNLRGLFFFTSDHIKNDMNLVGMGGSAMTEPSVERDMLLAKLFRANRDFTLVTKSDDLGNRKVFGVRSGKYKPLSQQVLVDVVKSLNKDGIMGQIVCKTWEINHFITTLDVEFPDKAEEMMNLEVNSGKTTTKKLSSFKPTSLVPGLRLVTSDTGDSSVQVMGTWRVGNSRIITDSVATRHSEKASVEEIVKNCEKNIFDGFRLLPERLCELTMLDITNPEWNLDSVDGEINNRKAVKMLMESLFNQLKIEKAIGKKRCSVLYELITESLDYTLPFTGYDIAMILIDIPSRLQNVDKSIIERLEKALGKIVYCDFTINNMYLI